MLYPRNVTIEIAKKQDNEVKSANSSRQKLHDANTSKQQQNIHNKDDTDDIRKQVVAINDWMNLDDAEEFQKASELLPCIDEAAETTMGACGTEVSKNRKKSKKDSSSHEDWLTKIATGLLKSSGSKSSKSNKKKMSCRKDNGVIEEQSRSKPLIDMKAGERFGCRVVNMKMAQEGICIVGEVSPGELSFRSHHFVFI